VNYNLYTAWVRNRRVDDFITLIMLRHWGVERAYGNLEVACF